VIDDSDGDFALLLIGGPIGLVLAIVLYLIAADNKKECAEMACPNGAPARLLDHDCLCVDKPDGGKQ
jgi:hypothetical protein